MLGILSRKKKKKFKTSKMKNFILGKTLVVTNMLTIKIFSGMYN